MPSSSSHLSISAKHRSWFLGGGMLLLLLIGGGSAVWLTQRPQDLRQQAKMAAYDTANLAGETKAVKTTAETKGISLNDTEATALSQKIAKVKAGRNPGQNPPAAPEMLAAEQPTESNAITAAVAVPNWEVGVTNFALEKLRNASYSPFIDTTPQSEAYIQAVKAGKPANAPRPPSTSRPTILTTTALGSETSLTSQLNSSAVLPATYDWRSAQGANFMTPVKNQGACGACWAFSGNSTLETAIAAYFNQPNKELDLSEQNLLSCSTNTTGCVGTQDLTKDYNDYVRAHGVVTESCMAYKHCDQTIASCSCPAGARCSGAAASALYTATYSTVPVVWADQSKQIVDAYATANNIKRAIIEHGAISTGIYIYSDLELYVGGVYQRTKTSTFEGGHVITLVGWGEENGQPYWLFKNSWSTQWGQNGYGKYKMFGAKPGSKIDLNEVHAHYRETGGPDFGIEGLAALYLYGGKPLLSYIDTPQLQGDTVSRACTDRDNDSYCFWGFGSTKPATGCPASCANHVQADCDDGRNNLGANCAAINPSTNPTPFPTRPPSPTATRRPTRTPTARPTARPTAKPTTKPTAIPTPVRCGNNGQCPTGFRCYQPPVPDCRPNRVCTQKIPDAYCRPIQPTATPRPTRVPTPIRCDDPSQPAGRCPTGFTCYKPPMPTCRPGQACAEIMPLPYCRPVKPSETPQPTTVPGAAAADINENGTINLEDLTILLADYGRTPLLNARSDVNRDGAVNALDYVLVLDFYGQSIKK